MITSGLVGINATSSATSILAAAGSTITVNAAGTINSGSSGNSSNFSSGISAGYSGGSGLANTAVNGAVIVNNGANITEHFNNGINVFNDGNGDITVNDLAGTITAAQDGIFAGQFSGGTGTIIVDISAAVTVTGTTGNGVDVNNSAGTGDISITADGAVTGGFNGINAIENGNGKITIGGSGNATGNSGYGIFAQETATALGGISINGSGNVTGAGSGFDGIHAEIDNTNDSADVSVSQTGNVSGGLSGIEASTQGNGNVTVTTGANATITGSSLYGIHANEFGTGNVLITTASGDQINSASGGIVASNHNAATSQAAYSTVTVNAYGAINSGSTVNGSGSRPAGILAGFNGKSSGTGTPNAFVLGDVLVNNYVNITSGQNGNPQTADGIRAFNYGVGNVTVVDGTFNNVANGRERRLPPRSTVLRRSANSHGAISVSTSPGDAIVAGSDGILANNQATAIAQSAHSTMTVNAFGTIGAGSTPEVGNGVQAGIRANFSGGASANNPNVYGDVVVNNFANITSGGDGIRAGTYGVGNVTVNDGTWNNVIAGPGTTIDASARNGIYGYNYLTGDISISMSAGDSISSGSSGILASNDATAIAAWPKYNHHHSRRHH